MDTLDQKELLRALPQVEEVLQSAKIQDMLGAVPRNIVVDHIRASIDRARQEILAGALSKVDVDQIVARAIEGCRRFESSSLRRVINASGVVVHTNLGRSVLSEDAVAAVNEVARGYSTLEYDTNEGKRGNRSDHYEQLICALTGAEAAIVVNNNAAAVMMVLSVFAADHEALVSRGELVEIGGSFRVPDIMQLSHAQMIEVGTTNKTHLDDYADALTDNTAMILKVHPSNYRMVGFTQSVGIKELKALADKVNAQRYGDQPEILVYEDQGSGALISLDCFGSYAEPVVSESIKQGCDLVSFSGDKLLGGPQAGIIVGRRHLIDRLKKSPLSRALRLDKLSLAALEATLRIYFSEEKALKTIPTLAMLTMSAGEAELRAEHLKSQIENVLPKDNATLRVVSEVSRAGGGALPMCDIETACVSIGFLRGSAQECESFLIGQNEIPIIARIKKDKLLLDPRTIIDDQEVSEIVQALKRYFEGQA